jgi:peptide/nickel transport system permease protein
VVRRSLEKFLLLAGITLVSFFVIHLAPGAPGPLNQGLNSQADSEAGEKLEKLYGLDQPVWVQYGRWLNRIVRLDFGNSLTDGEKVIDKIGKAIPVTLGISLLSLALVFGLGVPVGVLAATHRGKFPERLLSVATFAGISMPTFWLALVSISLFGVSWRALPVSGLHSLFSEERGFFWQWVDLAKHLALPVSVNAVASLAMLSRLTRANMIRVLNENYIRTARAKGLSEWQVVYRHALKNAMLPVITMVGLSLPGIFGGSVIVETIFSIPGMGRLFFSSVFGRDYPVIMAILVLGAFLTLLGNWLADAAYAWADPRIRRNGGI